jgi:HNH endonuclease
MFTHKVNCEHLCIPLSELIVSTYIPSFQRLEDQEHSQTISKNILSYYDEFKDVFLPGVLSLGKLPDKDKWILFDGQHRLRALESIKGRLDNPLIRVDLYHVASEEEARQMYHVINSNKKVDLFTGNVEPYILPQVQRYMSDRFPEYCKTSKRPIGLNINLDQMVKRMQAYKLVEKMGVDLDQASQITDRIRELNLFYQRQARSKFIEWGFKDLDKRFGELSYSNNPFYLGLYRDYEWIERIMDPRPFEEQEHYVQEKAVKVRTKIPKQVRLEVWNKRNDGLLEGICYCCGKPIHFNNFDCGHVISARDGGLDAVDNLEPICRTCNLDMGSINLEEYKRLFVA